MERKDIQNELYKITKDMSPNNIYSQLTYFLVEVALCNESHSDAHGIAEIIGLISDSYFGKVISGYANDERTCQERNKR